MYLILFVLDDTKCLEDVLQAWEECGVNGITILPSTGLAKLRQRKSALRENLPLMPSLQDIIRHAEQMNRTLFTIVEDDKMVDAVVHATQSVVGDLNEPNTGVMAVLPLARAYGLHRKTNAGL
ncbi:MAG: hypothetical protein WHV66_08610 [Anaerolineales bacterium]